MTFRVEPQQNDGQHLRQCMAKPRDMCSTLQVVHGWVTRECAQHLRQWMTESQECAQHLRRCMADYQKLGWAPLKNFYK